MKTPVACLRLTLGVGLFTGAATAQTVTTSAALEVPLKWNSRGSDVLSVPIKNDSDKPLKVLGVQATRGLFLGDYPSEIRAKAEDRISFIYQAPDNTEGSVDIIRVLTDRGIVEIPVKLAREEAVRFDSRKVSWQVGEASDEKSITITVSGSVTMPKAARTTKGNSATLDFLGGGQFRVRVRPGSTSDVQTFPVFVDFDPALPGGAMVLTCAIEKPIK